MSDTKKRKIIILNKEREQSLINLFDDFLKCAGIQALQHVNAVASYVEEEDLAPKATKKNQELTT
jgi:hypothetical protein